MGIGAGGDSSVLLEDPSQANLSSRSGAKSGGHIPPVDWVCSKLYNDVLTKNLEFNKEKDLRYFKENEIDYIIEMMKNRYRDFKRSEMTRPFYIKAMQTLEKVHEELDLGAKLRSERSFIKNYSEVRYELK